MHEGRVTRRRMLFGRPAAIGAAAFLAACGDDDDSDVGDDGRGWHDGDDCRGGTATTAARRLGDDRRWRRRRRRRPRRAARRRGGQRRQGQDDRARRRAGPHRFRLVLRQDDEPRPRPRRQAHRRSRRPDVQLHLHRPQVGRRRSRRAGDGGARSKGVQAKFASYVDDLGAMLAGTAEYKMFTLDGGGGTSIFGQGQPYFWGTRAITPNDPMPGLFQWLKET